MNNIINKFLLTGDKFMPEMHLRQPFKTFTLQCLWTSYKKDTRDLVRGTQSDKVLRDKEFKIASDPKYDGYQRGLAYMFYIFSLIKSLNEVELLMSQIIN